MAVNLFTNGAGGNTWNTAGNWSLGTVPTVSDGHVTTFDATSPNCTMGAARSCNNIDFTGYTNTLTMSTFTLTVAGNVTLDTGMNISGTGQLTVSATSTITSNGYTWPNSVSFTGGSTTKTLVGDLTITGLLTISSGGGLVNKTTTEKLYLDGGVTVTTNLSGTADVYLRGGTWSAGASGTLSNNLFIEGGTTSGTVRYSTGTIKYNSGTLSTGTSVINFVDTSIIDTNGINWYDITFSGSGKTYTINSLLTATHNIQWTITATSSITFNGTSGFICSSFIIDGQNAQTITLKESVTYTITSLFECYKSRVGTIVLFTSAHASTKAILTLQNGATCQCLANFTRIDASGGRTIRSFNGTITDCNNVVSFYDLKTIAA